MKSKESIIQKLWTKLDTLEISPIDYPIIRVSGFDFLGSNWTTLHKKGMKSDQLNAT